MSKFSILKSASAVNPADATAGAVFNPPTIAKKVVDVASQAGNKVKEIASTVAAAPGKAGDMLGKSIGPVGAGMDFGDLKDDAAQTSSLTNFASDPTNKALDPKVVARLNALKPEDLKALFKARGVITPDEAPMQREVNRLLNPDKYAPMKEKPMTLLADAPPGVVDAPGNGKFDWSKLLGPGLGAGTGFLLGKTVSGLADGEDEEENKRRANRLALLGALGGGAAGYALT